MMSSKKTRLPDGRRTPTYTVWITMKTRCLNPNSKNFHRYGGRGIRICEQWKNFTNFLNDMGERPEGATIDRIDNDGNYEPENCRWASPKENSRNRSDNRLLTCYGKTKTLAEWVEYTGHTLATLQGRVRMGWSDEEILTTPVRQRSSNLVITINGTSKPLAQWCSEFGISQATARHRLRKQGMAPAEALGITEAG